MLMPIRPSHQWLMQVLKGLVMIMRRVVRETYCSRESFSFRLGTKARWPKSSQLSSVQFENWLLFPAWMKIELNDYDDVIKWLYYYLMCNEKKDKEKWYYGCKRSSSARKYISERLLFLFAYWHLLDSHSIFLCFPMAYCLMSKDNESSSRRSWSLRLMSRLLIGLTSWFLLRSFWL